MKVPVRVPCRAGSAWNSGRVVHREVRREAGEDLPVGTNEHVAHERHVPRIGQDVADAQAVRRVGAAVEVLHEEVGKRVQVRLHVAEERREVLGREGLVDLAPVHVTLGARLPDDELVVGRAAGVRRRDGDERTHVGEAALAAADRRLDELGGDEVPVHRAGRVKILAGETERTFTGSSGRMGVTRGMVSGIAECPSGHRRTRHRALDQRTRSCASMTATAAMLTISCVSAPCSSTCTGWFMPTRIGPMAVAPPSRASSL